MNPRIAVTGPDGFLAWHLRCAHWAHTGVDITPIGRSEYSDAARMDAALEQVDVVVHLAGVNRGVDDSVLAKANIELAQGLATGLARAGRSIDVIYGNSIHSRGVSAFGSSKRRGAEILEAACGALEGRFVDVLLPNVFGEHGKPFYNSFVASFCHQLARGDVPTIDLDREVPLLHAQDAAAVLLVAAGGETAGELAPAGTPFAVSEVLKRLSGIRDRYVDAQLPDLSDPFTRALFNTYRSYTVPQGWPIMPTRHSDQRGSLVEAVRASGGETQVFYSTTVPGFTRGEHFHLRKVERFLVLSGEAVIRMRRLFTEEVVEFRVSGDEPAILDMPTLWTHSIINVGDRDLLTLFYADDEFNPADPDTYWIAV